MLNNIKTVAIVGVLGYLGYTMFLQDNAQTADLGQVLDRTDYAISGYQGYLADRQVTEVSDGEVEEFRTLLTEVLNAEPRFYDERLGLEIQQDAKFLGFADKNGNGTQDSGEGDVFTVEIDEANNRLIATDMAGNSSGLRFSGAGFLAGALIGNLINRQRGAGIKANSFNNRSVTPRSSYTAPRSARSGGLRAGK